jgi:hypothetical protein
MYAPFTLAAIPIGSFEPTHLMKHLHMGPEDAIKAHIDLGCPRLSVGIHWATFMMSDEYYLAPKEILNKTWDEYFNSTEEITDEDLLSIASSSSSTLVSCQQQQDNNIKRRILTESKFTTTLFGQTVCLN